MDYKNAGVDIEAGYKSVELMKEHIKKTMRPEVIGGLGGFSGAFSLEKIKEMEEPVLLSGTDGCGTKVKLAMVLDKHDTIGIDAVAMCVNDIACAGGEPLFFLDYIACGKNEPEKIISGGPMMGKALFTMNVPVIKTSSAILAMTEDEVAKNQPTACINCGRCAKVCPGQILPVRLAEFAEHGNEEQFLAYHGMECCECGCCSFVCPAKRQLTQSISSMRKIMLAKRKKG